MNIIKFKTLTQNFVNNVWNNKKYKRLIIVFLSIIVIAVCAVTTYFKVWHIPKPTKFINKYYNPTLLASQMSADINIETSNNIFSLTYKAEQDNDTCHLKCDDNGQEKEMYIDVLDKKYGIYTNINNKWSGDIVKKIAAIDDPRTVYIESGTSTQSAALTSSDFTDLTITKNPDKTYDVHGYTSYNKALTVFGMSIYALSTSDSYEELKSYFNLYAPDIKVEMTLHFAPNKSLAGILIESNADLAKAANSEYSKFDLTSLRYKITYNNYSPIDVYVPVDIDQEAFSK